MHLVHDDHLAAQPQVPHGQVRGAHGLKEQVVHGGDHEVGEHGLLAPVEPGQDGQVGPTAPLSAGGPAGTGLLLVPADPGGARDGVGLSAERPQEPVADLVAAPAQHPGLLIEPGATVHELDGKVRRRAPGGVGLLDPLQPGQLTGEHGVRGRLGGQGEEHPGPAGPGGEHLGGHEGGLGLAASCGLLDNEHPRQLHGAGRLQGACLHVGGPGSPG